MIALGNLLPRMRERFGITKQAPQQCPEHGEYLAGLIHGKWSSCPPCAMRARQDAMDAARRRDSEEARAAGLRRLLGGAAIPPRYVGKGFDTYVAENDGQRAALAACQAYADSFPDRMRDGRGMVLLGTPGTGKTHLAVSIARHVMEVHRMGAVFTSVSAMARAFKDNWTSRELTESEILATFTAPALLTLDEVGVGWGSDTEMNFLFEVVNARYLALKPTILVGNVEKPQLRALVGDRVASRLNEGRALVVPFKWDDHRAR